MVQPIKLVPADGGPTIVIGVANTVKQTAELRSYALLTEQYAQRYKGAPIPIHVGAYTQLLVDFTSFFQAMSLSVTTVNASGSTRAPPAAQSSGNAGAIAALVVSVSVLVTAAWLVLSHLHN